MKDIIIIANFCRDFSETDNGRFMYLCKTLSKLGHKVEIITSDFSHALKAQKKPLIHNWPFTITFLHEPGYKRNISVNRFVSHHSWGKEVEKYLKTRDKPDIIYCAVPSLTGPLLSAKYCKRNNLRFIIDIQDIWPEAFKLAFNVPIISFLLFFPFSRIANGIYSRADEICGVSRTYVKRALEVNPTKHGHVVYLGTQLSTFETYARDNIVNKPDGELWLGYCGTLGASYDISVVIDALSILQKRGINTPKFIVMGDGERRLEFEKYAQLKAVDCLFTGKLPYNQMCGRLAACDIAANPIMHNAAQSIINKHGDYASAGLPVINTQECQEYRDLVNEYKMGFNVDNNDAEGFANKLEILIENEMLRNQMKENAYRCAKERFDRAHTYKELIDLFGE